MATESERCVDELMIKVSKIDRYYEELKSDQKNCSLIDEARSTIKDLQSFIDNNKPSIPSYCLKKAIEASSKLESLIDDPLKKAKVQFKFSSLPKQHKKSDRSNTKDEEKLIKSESVSLKNELNVPAFGFNNRTNESLGLNMNQVHMKDVNLTKLRGCAVTIHGLAGAIYISDLFDTSVTICLAQRAVTVRNCSNCSFKLVCQQLRIDSTKNVRFNTFISCRSMLESSVGLEFRSIVLGELGITEEHVSQLFKEAGFDCSRNNWRMIDDFDSLARGGESSQNFTLVDD